MSSPALPASGPTRTTRASRHVGGRRGNRTKLRVGRNAILIKTRRLIPDDRRVALAFTVRGAARVPVWFIRSTRDTADFTRDFTTESVPLGQINMLRLPFETVARGNIVPLSSYYFRHLTRQLSNRNVIPLLRFRLAGTNGESSRAHFPAPVDRAPREVRVAVAPRSSRRPRFPPRGCGAR